MFFSNSTIIVRVNNLDIRNELMNFSFFESNGDEDNSRKFFSINFYDYRNDIGELHYTNSFEYGSMNVINFIRKSNLFFLFTSSVQHTKFFKKIIKTMTSKEVDFEILRIPLNVHEGPLINIKNFSIVETDSLSGIIGSLKHNDNSYLIKIYSNGLITFPFTNNKEIVEEVISTSLEVLNHYGKI